MRKFIQRHQVVRLVPAPALLFMPAALLFFIVVFWLAPGTASAGPALPEPLVIEQPDGTRFTGYIRGDERRNWVETAAGYSVSKNQASGYWEYAVHDHEGQLAPSGVRVAPLGRAPQGFQPHLTPAAPAEPTLEQGPSLMQTPVAQMGTWTPQPVSGTKKMLVILVEFNNRSLSTNAAGWEGTIFAGGGAKSVANYYAQNSFGNLSITPVAENQGTVNDGIVTVTLNIPHPNDGAATSWAAEEPMMQGALTAASPYIDFDALDGNNDGRLSPDEVVVYLIVAGFERSGALNKSPSVWAHAWSCTSEPCDLGLLADSKKLTRIALNGELNDSSVQHPMGVIAHELGHQMCALPDLYDTSGNNGAMGYFSIMASGSWGGDVGEYPGTTPTALDAWSREHLGWAAPRIPALDNQIMSIDPALSANDSPIKLMDGSHGANEFFLVENRYYTGWDKGFYRQDSRIAATGGGLLIIHVDQSSTPGSNDLNNSTVGSHQGVVPEQASTSDCNMIGSTCRGSIRTLFYLGNNSSFGSSTSPNSRWYSGAVSGFSVTEITAPATTMYARIVSPVGAATTPPKIVWRSPADGGVNAFVSTDVEMVFNEDMDGATINTTNITLTKQGGGAVAGIVSLAGDNRTATFNPNAALSASTTYIVAVSNFIQDAEGNYLDQAYSWTFTTGTDNTDADGDGVEDLLDDNPGDAAIATPMTHDGSAKMTIQTTTGGTALASVSTQAATDGVQTNRPNGAYPYGLVNFKITGLANPGDTVTVTITYPDPIPSNAAYYKVGPSGWSVYNNVTFAGNTATLTLTDNGAGDWDGMANQQILDPGGLVLVTSTITSTAGGEGGGGGGGCFLTTTGE